MTTLTGCFALLDDRCRNGQCTGEETENLHFRTWRRCWCRHRRAVRPQGFEYQRFREFMTQEVNAAIEAAFAAGATEIVVSDSHGNGQNLLIEKLPTNILLVRSWPRPLMMMQGIDETFAGAIFLGYHSGTTNPQGVRAHTISSARLADVKLNSISVPEAGINAAIAVILMCRLMISGDDML